MKAMISLAPCSCCEGYVVQCDKCSAFSSKCSNQNEALAAEAAKKIGWTTFYTSPSAAASWSCPTCTYIKGEQKRSYSSFEKKLYLYWEDL